MSPQLKIARQFTDKPLQLLCPTPLWQNLQHVSRESQLLELLKTFPELTDIIKFVFMSFLAIFEFGSLLCAVSVSSNMLIVGRAVTGIGGSGLLNAGLTIIRACVPMEKSARTCSNIHHRYRWPLLTLNYEVYVGFIMGCKR